MSTSVYDMFADILDSPPSPPHGRTNFQTSTGETGERGENPHGDWIYGGAKHGRKGAKMGRSMGDQGGDSPQIRPDSPPLRPAANRATAGFSPLSPLSPHQVGDFEAIEKVDTPRRRWLLRFPDGRVISTSLTPGATEAEMRAWYPDATVTAEEAAHE